MRVSFTRQLHWTHIHICRSLLTHRDVLQVTFISHKSFADECLLPHSFSAFFLNAIKVTYKTSRCVKRDLHICMWVAYISLTYIKRDLHICMWVTSKSDLHICMWEAYICRPLTGEIRHKNIWISRLSNFPGHSLEWRGLRLLTWKSVWNVGNSQENVFDLYGDFCENLLEIVAVVILWSLISSVCDVRPTDLFKQETLLVSPTHLQVSSDI